MACYSPLKASISKRGSDGKKLVKIYPSSDAKESDSKIPCGKCIACRLDYSQQWATRCYLEAKQYEHNYFITLTYNPENLPTNPYLYDEETGSIHQDTPTLNPQHLTKFMKDLRRYYEYHREHTGIKFFACGEYGEKTQRPHYHLILFNLPVDDLKYYKTNFSDKRFYTSATLEKIWGKGFVVIGEVSYESAAYTARYILKKQTGKDSKYVYLNREKEFSRMSRNTGIGYNYFYENKDKIYNDGAINVRTKDKVIPVKIPAYFDDLMETYNPELLYKTKDERLKHMENKDYISKITYDVPHHVKIANDFYNRMASIKALKRDGVE